MVGADRLANTAADLLIAPMSAQPSSSQPSATEPPAEITSAAIELILRHLSPLPTTPIPPHLLSQELLQRHHFLSLDPASDALGYLSWPSADAEQISTLLQSLSLDDLPPAFSVRYSSDHQATFAHVRITTDASSDPPQTRPSAKAQVVDSQNAMAVSSNRKVAQNWTWESYTFTFKADKPNNRLMFIVSCDGTQWQTWALDNVEVTAVGEPS